MVLLAQVELVLLQFFMVLVVLVVNGGPLEIGFYNESCPSAEETVKWVVARAYESKPGIAPGLIRLHFHDCFVRGCDGSVLLDSTPGNPSEKEADPNKSLQGFEVIDKAKEMIEAQCPHIVSCADILAFAARDSATLAGKIDYQVPVGRLDGRVSIASEVLLNIPSPLFNATQLVANFAVKNLTAEDMVTLSGAHSIGVAHCDAFINRLYNFSETSDVDPSLDPIYAKFLKIKCPPNVTHTDPTIVQLDALTPETLDNKYYVGLKLNLGLLTSDQALLTNETLEAMVNMNAYHPEVWDWAFAKAMVKMGEIIEVETGTEGEIRVNCRVINSGSFAFTD
ncbi:peroxidase 5-like [Macadamia integrifolia]|uniref:peroxidase 5-like n=1 Tax=Macadamia integrifolia TaxID=60698 RepID=UPI001C4F1750|nr:peroxidase 5-like [Macadamia integrifolia]